MGPYNGCLTDGAPLYRQNLFFFAIFFVINLEPILYLVGGTIGLIVQHLSSSVSERVIEVSSSQREASEVLGALLPFPSLPFPSLPFPSQWTHQGNRCWGCGRGRETNRPLPGRAHTFLRHERIRKVFVL